MTPKAKLSVDQFAVDDLVLPVSGSYDPAQIDLHAYEDFIDAVVAGRDYSKQATAPWAGCYSDCRFPTSLPAVSTSPPELARAT
jgi:hypothetical protein